MSQDLHVKSLKITNLDAVRKAVDVLNQKHGKKIKFVEGKGARMWNGRVLENAPYYLKLQGNYDVGLVEHKENNQTHYTLAFDDWGGHVFKELGQHIDGIEHGHGHVRQVSLGKRFTADELALSNVNLFATTYTEQLIEQECSEYMIQSEEVEGERVLTLSTY